MSDNREHLILIRLSALGDVAMTVPVILALKEAHPEVKITVVTRKNYSPIFLEIPQVSTFIADTTGRHRGLAGLYQLSKDIRALNPTAIADLHYVLRTRIIRLFLIGFGIPFAYIDKGRTEKRALTRSKHKRFKPLKSTIQRYADVIERIGFKVDPFKRRYCLPSLAWPEKFDTNTKGIKIGIAPFAAHQGKCYPEALMQQVIAEFQTRVPHQIYLFGGGKVETDKLSDWEKGYSNCRNAAGKLSLAEELAVISNLDLMISMDSGNGHLAAMFGVPVITLWGVTHPFAGFAPYGQSESYSLLADRNRFPKIPTSVYGNRTPPGYELAIAGIPPTDVVQLALQILEPISKK